MKRLWIVGLMVMGSAAATPTRASADWRVAIGGSHDRGTRGAGPAFRYGYDRGWREGSEEGHNDGRRSRDPRFWREGEYRDGDRGYKGWMPPVGLHRRIPPRLRSGLSARLRRRAARLARARR